MGTLLWEGFRGILRVPCVSVLTIGAAAGYFIVHGLEKSIRLISLPRRNTVRGPFSFSDVTV